MREETPALGDTLNLPAVREEAQSQKIYFLFQTAERKAVEEQNDIWSISCDFVCGHPVALRGHLFTCLGTVVPDTSGSFFDVIWQTHTNWEEHN